MDELEIKIVLRYKVQENGLTLNGILRGLEQDKNIVMRSMVKAILHALEEKAAEKQIIRYPGRYIRYGRLWSEQGLTNWLAIAMRKIFVPTLWDKLWKDYLRINKQLSLSRLKVEHVWI